MVSEEALEGAAALTKCGGRCWDYWEVPANEFEIEETGENQVDSHVSPVYSGGMGSELNNDSREFT